MDATTIDDQQRRGRPIGESVRITSGATAPSRRNAMERENSNQHDLKGKMSAQTWPLYTPQCVERVTRESVDRQIVAQRDCGEKSRANACAALKVRRLIDSQKHAMRVVTIVRVWIARFVWQMSCRVMIGLVGVTRLIMCSVMAIRCHHTKCMVRTATRDRAPMLVVPTTADSHVDQHQKCGDLRQWGLHK